MIQADLSGRTAIVTGASSGFGRHFARVLASHGATVVVMARRADRLDSLVAEIEAAGGEAVPLALDVSDAEAVARAVDGLERIDIVVNNAGVAGASPTLDCEEDEWRWTFDVNVHATWFVARQAARHMIKAKRGGSIINIASITGLRPGVSAVAYASSKAAVVHLTKALAMEWARYDIRVNAIAPGYFETDLNRELLQSDYGEVMRKRIPQRRFGELADLDGPLLLLASEASRYMTGSVIAVDGGHLVSPL
ncbi:MAG TPA: SDR family NAD(P)-dependent oxidoreductase [Caulobacteraceae bacterium]|jgi:NAD(P)-dependent dehydrogenase (short-subunit alcohol dehydrogenase family)